jgi:hypothetical protein
MIRSFRELTVYQKAFEQAMCIFKMLGSMISAPEKFCYRDRKAVS